MQDQETVLYQQQKGIALITLNRPPALNALNVELLQRLSRHLDQAQASDSVKAVIITGAGDTAFSAGADIKVLNQATPLAVRDFARLAIAVNHKIETMGKLVIAAINGYAFGGGLELAESCMIREIGRAHV